MAARIRSRTIELWFRAAEVDFLPGQVGMLYEEGGATRGLNMYVQEVDGAVHLFMTGWNLAEEQWGPIVVNDEIETEEVYHAVMVLDASSDQIFGNFDGRITAYLNGEKMGETDGADRLYAHGDDVAIGGIHVNTLFPDLTNPGDGANFNGVIDEVALYGYPLDDPDRDGDLADSRVMEHYVVGARLISPCFTADPTEGSAPLTVTLNASCTESKFDIESLKWEFSDGETAEGRDVTHEFKTNGPHRATLIVRTTNGLSSTSTRDIRVSCSVPGFEGSDIGESTVRGGQCVAADACIDLWGSGRGFSSASGDTFYFLHREVQGDVTITARIREASIAGSGIAGIMLRGDLDTKSSFAAIGIRSTATSAITYNRADKEGRVSSRTRRLELMPPDSFLRLERRGGEIVASASADGVTFTEVRTLLLNDAGETLLAGLAVTTLNASDLDVSRAVFCDVEFTEGTGPSGFLRGDCSTDGNLDLADPIANLSHQFLGRPASCLDACDFDDNGMIEVTDPIASLAHQFLGSAPPTAPGLVKCGPDPTPDDLDCRSFGACR